MTANTYYACGCIRKFNRGPNTIWLLCPWHDTDMVRRQVKPVKTMRVKGSQV